MGKFNINSISGYGEKKEKNNVSDVDRFRLGEELLDEKSRDIVKLRIYNIERNKIVKNPDNKYSIEGIDALAESIKVSGLDQPLIVKKIEEDKYMLLGGERRLTAIDKLIADDSVEAWNEFTLMPCVIKDINKINLPLSEKNKEKYAIISTNKEARKYTDADRLQEMLDWKEIINELRENGVESISTINQENEEQEIKIKGEKTLDILSQTTGISRGQLQKFESVEKNASPELLGSLMSNEVSIGTASKAVDKLTKDEQAELAKAAKEREIKPADVNAFKKHEDKIELSSKQFKKDIKEISNALANSVYLSEEDKEEYDKTIKKLKAIIAKGESDA